MRLIDICKDFDSFTADHAQGDDAHVDTMESKLDDPDMIIRQMNDYARVSYRFLLTSISPSKNWSFCYFLLNLQFCYFLYTTLLYEVTCLALMNININKQAIYK